MRCPACEARNKRGVRFCTSCGAQLDLACGSCGFVNEPEDRFCASCGKGLAAIQQPSARRAPETGELKRVSMLFADIKGATASIEGLDPEAALNHLEPALQIMIQQVNRYAGTLCRRLGDGVLAVFGAPIAHEDHAVRACLAALGMQRDLRDAGWAEMVRIGINSGDILYRTVSSGLGLEVDVVGPSVHIAARMEQLAPPGSVYMTGETQALIQGQIDTKEIGPQEIKGLSVPIEVFEAIGASPNRSRWLAAAGRDRAPFAGRSAERAMLTAALGKLGQRRGGVIGIRGEAGFGKSRLVRDVVGQSSEHTGHRTIFSGATPFGGDVPYHTLVLALRELLGISEQLDASEVPGVVASVLGELDPSLELTAPALSSLISPATAPADWLALDPTRKRSAVRDACQRLARVAASRTPLALVIEDVHWIDRESEGVLRAIAGVTADTPLLLVLTYRPQYDDDWLEGVAATRLNIPPLTDDEVRCSLREWFVAGAETEHLIETLASRVGGSPLFVEECVRSLVNAAALTTETVGDSGTQVARRRYACTRAPQAIALPPSVRDVIASRIDRRSPGCLATLHTLAVVDRPIPRWLAEGICSWMGADPTTTLREAVSADILIEANISPEVEYDFAHAVLREVAHDALTRPRRTEAHRGVFSLIEERYSGRLEDQAEWLAHHALLGELWDQSAAHQGHAAERAIARGSYDEAIARIHIALRSYEQSTRSQAATERAIDQLGTLRGLLAATEVDSEEANIALAQAEELARRIDDRIRLAWVWADQAAQKWVAGENAEAIAKARASLEIAEQSGDARLRALALVRLGIALHAVGEFVEAAERLRDCRATLSGDLRFARIGTTNTTSILAGGFLVGTLCELGLFDEAERTVNDVIDIAAIARDVYSIASAQVTRCTLAVARGQVDTAIHPLETLRTAAKAARAMQVLLFIEILLGRAKLIAGDKSGALALLKATENPVAARRASIDRMNQVWLAEALAANGAADEAQAILNSVEAEAKQHGEAATVVHCCAIRGKIAWAVGDVTKAQAAFEGALRGATKLSMRPVSALCEAGLVAIATPVADAPAARRTAT